MEPPTSYLEPVSREPLQADLCFSPSHHVALAISKDEDVSIVRESMSSSGISLYAVADGHNGSAVARHVGLMLPDELERQLGSGPCVGDAALRQALARTFLAADAAVCQQYQHSDCTLSVAVVSGDVLTLANVGDSTAILDTGSEVVQLTADHRIGQCPGEFARLEQAGGRLARLNQYGAGPSSGVGDGVGPVRLWPGGIMVGRGIGDKDVGDILLPNPHIRQVRLPPTGARLILASDGLWDTMPAGRVARVLRSHGSAKAAATQAVTSVAASRAGLLADDVTVIVVDILPPGCTDFREVCAKFGGRLRTALSNPNLSTLVEEMVQPPQPQAPPKRGLFACFSKPAVVDDSRRRAYTPSSSLGTTSSYTPSGSIHGGSERSVRGGVVRDPSVRGCKRAITVEVVHDTDSAYWAPADFGLLPRPVGRGCSRSSSMDRTSPRDIMEGLGFGLSHSSLASEEDPSQELSMSLSKGSLDFGTLSRKNTASGDKMCCGDKKCHGSNAAASLLCN